MRGWRFGKEKMLHSARETRNSFQAAFAFARFGECLLLIAEKFSMQKL